LIGHSDAQQFTALVLAIQTQSALLVRLLAGATTVAAVDAPIPGLSSPIRAAIEAFCRQPGSNEASQIVLLLLNGQLSSEAFLAFAEYDEIEVLPQSRLQQPRFVNRAAPLPPVQVPSAMITLRAFERIRGQLTPSPEAVADRSYLARLIQEGRTNAFLVFFLAYAELREGLDADQATPDVLGAPLVAAAGRGANLALTALLTLRRPRQNVAYSDARAYIEALISGHQEEADLIRSLSTWADPSAFLAENLDFAVEAIERSALAFDRLVPLFRDDASRAALLGRVMQLGRMELFLRLVARNEFRSEAVLGKLIYAAGFLM
jgi:hypothetical protein